MRAMVNIYVVPLAGISRTSGKNRMAMIFIFNFPLYSVDYGVNFWVIMYTGYI